MPIQKSFSGETFPVLTVSAHSGRSQPEKAMRLCGIEQVRVVEHTIRIELVGLNRRPGRKRGVDIGVREQNEGGVGYRTDG